MITSTDAAGKAYLKAKESLRLKAYKLAGESGYTIGYGNKYYENGNSVKQTDTITATRASQLFENILRGFEINVNKVLTANVNQSQYNALLSYAYNRGFTTFKNTDLLKMVNQNPNNQNIYNQFILEWGTNQNYKTAIIARRKEEAEIYVSGGMAGSGLVTSSVLVTALIGYGIYKIIK
jgi:lysozyme